MPMPSNEARRNLLPNEPIESFWDALWLGIRPSLCSIIEFRRNAHRCLPRRRGSISWCVGCRREAGSFLVSGHVWEWVTCRGGRHSPRARSPVTHLDPTPPHHRSPVGANHAKCAPRLQQKLLIIGIVWASCVTLLQKSLPHHRNFYEKVLQE